MDVLFALVISAGLLYSLLSVLVLVYERYRASQPSRDAIRSAPVSVLKPLKGVDDSLEENLRSFFSLDYPCFELVFGVDDLDDPAVKIVRALQDEYPQVRSALVIDDYRVGLNPKINNLHNMYRRASHDHIVISDSNVRVRPDYLTDLVSHIEPPEVGLVSSLIRGEGEKTIGSLLENTHMNSFVSGSVMSVRRLFGIPVTIGKSMIIRRETLEMLGGFEAFESYLAEDQLMGLAVRRLGLRVDVSFHAVESVNVSWTIGKFVSRHLRWATMRRHLGLFRYLAEALSNPILFGLAYLLLNRDEQASLAFAAVCCAKIALDSATLLLIGARPRLSHLVVIPAKDILMGMLWLLPHFIRRVTWRGNRFVISRQTQLSPAPVTRFQPRVAWSRVLQSVSRVALQLRAIASQMKIGARAEEAGS